MMTSSWYHLCGSQPYTLMGNFLKHDH